MNKKIGKHSNKNGNKGKSMKLMAAAMAETATGADEADKPEYTDNA